MSDIFSCRRNSSKSFAISTLIRVKLKRVVSNNVLRFSSGGNSYYEKFADGRVKCIDEEIPFEPPKGWIWERFGNLVFNRDSERIPLSVSERNDLAKKYDYYGASGVIDKVDRPLFRKPLLLIGEDGANLINRSTPIAFIAKGEYWVNNHAHVIDCRDLLALEYLCLYINAIPLTPYVTGTAQPKMNQEKMNSILVAVPPIAEQVRIVKKYSEIEPIISKFSLAQRRMDKLNDEFNERLRKSILQEAIQGKLVPQDPNEEPVSELLNRIQAEKQKLLKEGKLKKKDIVDSVIYKGEDNKYYEKIGGKILDISDEIPFDIPSSWEWIRLGHLVRIISGTSYQKGDVTTSGIRILRGGNIQNNQLVLSPDDVWLPFSYRDSEKNIQAGDILIVGSTGSPTVIGKPAIVLKNIENVQIGAFLRVLRPYFGWSFDYLHLLFITEYYREHIRTKAKGTNINNIKAEYIEDMLVPLPPLKEQTRINEKQKKLLEILH